jgi:hypothetical protein
MRVPFDRGIERNRSDMDELYQSMQRRGFLSHELRGQKLKDLSHIYIARNGGVLFGTQGNHRLAMAKLLELEKIACYVVERHAAWQALYRRLTEIEFGLRRASLSSDLADHPAGSLVPTSHDT